MTYDQAVQALENAVGQDMGEAPAPAPAPAAPQQTQWNQSVLENAQSEQPRHVLSPEQQTQQAAPPAQSTPQGPESATPAAAEDTTPFTERFDPNSLPPELEPAYKLMQADYTRKTQQLAEQARQYQQLGDMDPATIQEAVQTYEWLSDPNNWPAAHAQLTQNLQQMGLSPADASAEASRQLGAQAGATPAQSQQLSADLMQDPELAPIAQQMQAMQQQVSLLQQQLTQQQQAEQAASLQNALVGELIAQEQMIRENNPTYAQSDIDACYELSSFYGGNLLDAQTRYEEMRNTILSQYLNEKSSVMEQPGVRHAQTAQQVSHLPGQRFKTLEEAHDAAMESLQHIENIQFS